MSQNPRRTVPPRRVSGDQPQGNGGSGGGARGSSQQPAVGGGGRSGGSRRQVPPPPQRGGGGGRYYDDGGNRQGYRQPVNRRQGYYEPAPRRDPFPIVMGGIIGALAMGLVLVIFLLTQNNNNSNPVVSNPGVSNPGATTAPGGAQVEPTRIPFEEFKTLYDNQAQRPVVVDVRSKQAFDEGHIAGAINIPLAETDARIAEFPRDKLIVTYCQ
jgi:hypothetical protein